MAEFILPFSEVRTIDTSSGVVSITLDNIISKKTYVYNTGSSGYDVIVTYGAETKNITDNTSVSFLYDGVEWFVETASQTQGTAGGYDVGTADDELPTNTIVKEVLASWNNVSFGEFKPLDIDDPLLSTYTLPPGVVRADGQLIDDADSPYDGYRIKNFNGADVTLTLTWTADAGGAYATVAAEDLPAIAKGDWVTGSGIWTSIWTFTGHSDYVYSVAVSPNGNYVYSGSKDDTVKKIDASTREVVWTFTGHSDYVHSVAVSPDGNYVYSGSNDKAVRKINASTGAEVWTFGGHSEAVHSVAVSPDGNYVYSGSFDDTVKKINASTGAL